MSGLFRQEVINAKRGSWLGEIQIATPLRSWIVTLLFVGIAGVVLVFLFFGHYTRRERVEGQLVPTRGLLSVHALAAGTITRLDVHEGQLVQQGDPLIEISGDVSSSDFGDTRVQISQRLHAQHDALTQDLVTHAQSAAQQEGQLQTQIQLLHAQAAKIDAQIQLQRQSIASDETLLERVKPLLAKGYVSAFQVQQQRGQLLGAKAQLQAFARQRAQLEQQIGDAREKLAQIPLTLKMQQSATQRQLDQVEQQLAQNEAARSIVLHAPRDGMVSSQLVSAGQSVAAGQTLLNLLPKGSCLTARLLVPSRAVGFVDPGSPVVLRYQAYPYQKFGQYYGHVRAISRSALSPREVASLTGLPTKQPLYQVSVSLDRQIVMAYGKPQALKPGMALSADILLDRRRLIEWVFEPLYGIGRRVFGGEKDHG